MKLFRVTVGCASTADRNFAAMSPSSSRSRFFENTEWSHAASSTPIPTKPTEQKVVLQPLRQKTVREGSNRRFFAAALPAAAFPAGSKAARSANTAPRTLAPAPPALRSPIAPECAAQRMITPHPRLEIDITEQLARPFVPASHSSTSRISPETLNPRERPAVPKQPSRSS